VGRTEKNNEMIGTVLDSGKTYFFANKCTRVYFLIPDVFRAGCGDYRKVPVGGLHRLIGDRTS